MTDFILILRNQLSNLKEVGMGRLLVDLITAMSLSQWLVMRYSIFNMEIIEAAVKMAKQEKVFVSLDLASFEVHIPRQVQFYHLCDVILVLEKSLLYRLKRNENKVAHVSIFGQMVRDFRLPLLQLLESGDVDLCFANEDEAKELIG